MESSPAPPFQFVDDVLSFRANDGLTIHIPAKARGKQKLLGVLSSRLQFPRYFGGNWDALDECLRDLSWLTGVSHVTIVHDGLPFSEQGEQLTTYVKLLADVVAERRKAARAPTLDVVFSTRAREAVTAAL